MKRFGKLFEKVVARDNLWAAWLDFRRGKRRRPSVRAFEHDADRRVLALGRQLNDGCYQPGGYRLLVVREPKCRLIAAASVRDRVVHHAVYRVATPLLDRRLIDTCFACLDGRGSHRAVLALVRGMRRHRFLLHLDVRHYFLSIDRGILLDLLARQIKDRPLLDLMAVIAHSGHGLYQLPAVRDLLDLDSGFPGTECGLPIGNLTSQWWGNHYLSGLDHFVKRDLKIPHYQRYMDDFTLLGDSRSQLEEAREAIAEWLLTHRRLRLKKPHAPARPTSRRVVYLGHQVDRTGAAPRSQRRPA